MKRRADKKELIDVSTYWRSTILIPYRVVSLKAFVQDLGSQEIYLNQSELVEVDEMVQVLEIPYTATIFLQKQDLTLGKCLLH